MILDRISYPYLIGIGGIGSCFDDLWSKPLSEFLQEAWLLGHWLIHHRVGTTGDLDMRAQCYALHPDRTELDSFWTYERVHLIFNRLYTKDWVTLNTGLNQPWPIQSSLADKCPKSTSLPNIFFIYTHSSILSTTLVLSVLLRGLLFSLSNLKYRWHQLFVKQMGLTRGNPWICDY